MSDFSDFQESALDRRKREQAIAGHRWNVIYAVAASILAISLVGPGLGTIAGLALGGPSGEAQATARRTKVGRHQPEYGALGRFGFGAVGGIVGGTLGAVVGLYLYVRLGLAESAVGYVLLFLMLLGGVAGAVIGMNQTTIGTSEQGAVAMTTALSSGLSALAGLVLIIWVAHRKPQKEGPSPLPVPRQAEHY